MAAGAAMVWAGVRSATAVAQQPVATEHPEPTAMPTSARVAPVLVEGERFGRAHRLRSPADFARVRRVGRSYAGAFLILGAARRVVLGGAGVPLAPAAQPMPPARVGFTVGKRVGGAVTRNLVRRRLREAARRLLGRLAPGWDLVAVARPAAADATGTQLAHDLETLLVRAKVLEPGSERHTQ